MACPLQDKHASKCLNGWVQPLVSLHAMCQWTKSVCAGRIRNLSSCDLQPTWSFELCLDVCDVVLIQKNLQRARASLTAIGSEWTAADAMCRVRTSAESTFMPSHGCFVSSRNSFASRFITAGGSAAMLPH